MAWTIEDAIYWLKESGWNYNQMKETKNYYDFQQQRVSTRHTRYVKKRKPRGLLYTYGVTKDNKLEVQSIAFKR